MGKKLVLVLTFALCHFYVSAMSMEDMVKKYKSEQYVETMSVSGTVIRELAERDDNDILRRLTSIRLISMKRQAGEERVREFADEINGMMSGYEELLSFSAVENEVIISLNADRTEVLMLAKDPDEITLMCMKGNIDSVVIDALLNNDISIK